jgi:lysophospholipase L1-like esterase
MRALLLLLAAVAGASTSAAEPLQLTLPPTVYAAPGVPLSIYYDNVVLTEHPERYRFEVRCDVGANEQRRWTVTPKEQDAGDHAVEVVVRDEAGKILEQAKSRLHVAGAQAGADRTLKLLVVGDSLTAATYYPNEIARLLSRPGNPQWKMFGQHQPTQAAAGVAHEGYGGWTWNAFLTKYLANPEVNPGGKTWKSRGSPFVFADAEGKPALDIPRYFRETCGGATPDVVTFLLGINDCFHTDPEDRAKIDATIATTLENADKLLAAFHAAAPKAILAVGLTTPPNSREEGFETNYHGKYHRWGWKRIQHRLVQVMLQRFSGREQEGIVLVPTELNVDPVDGYPSNNGVHPNPTGYAQIGASFYAFLKAQLESR